MPYTTAQIYQKVKEVLVDALGVDEEDVKPNARLMADLGAESIDFLDIVFRLEKAFSIKISREEIFPGDGFFSDSRLAADGRLTDEGLAVLKKQLSHIDFSGFEKDPRLAKLGDLFTVEAVVRFLEHKLNASGPAQD
ncbi:MAG: acyl carrier protein [Sedimentisphaerales bacterium]|nr:acyl carrier protein [Sedimentisphaerales bacterium]